MPDPTPTQVKLFKVLPQKLQHRIIRQGVDQLLAAFDNMDAKRNPAPSGLRSGKKRRRKVAAKVVK